MDVGGKNAKVTSGEVTFSGTTKSGIAFLYIYGAAAVFLAL